MNPEKNHDLHAQTDLESFGYTQQLKRTLTFWQLTAFGLNYMVPIAPAVVFGYILLSSGGSVALPYLLAGIAMSTTAISYGILLKKFPLAGSLYSFVSRGMNPHIGFLAGWVLLLDYLLLPTITSMSVAIYINQIFPIVPYWLSLLVFVCSTSLLNLFGIDIVAKLGFWLLILGEVVIFVGFGVWSHAIVFQGVGVGHLFSLEPFHFQNVSTLASATAVAILSYLGFDAITTLAEEAKQPKKDMPKAILFAVLIGGLTMVITGYLGVLVVPNWQTLLQHEALPSTMLFYVAKITGGNAFTIFYMTGFFLAMGLFNTVSTAAAARLLYGMGRDEVLPRKVFSAINHRWKTPHWNIIVITLLEFIIGISFSIDSIFELVSYGAIFGFFLINLTVIWFFFLKNSSKKHIFSYVFFPLIGMIIMAWVFINLRAITLVVGSIWLLIGILYGAYKTQGYRKLPPIFFHKT